MGQPPPPPEPDAADQDVVDAGVDFDPSPPTASSICGFKFPPSFHFFFSFHLPGLPACLVDPLSCIPIPWLSLRCDLSDPIGAGWGGGRPVSHDDESTDEASPWVEVG